MIIANVVLVPVSLVILESTRVAQPAPVARPAVSWRWWVVVERQSRFASPISIPSTNSGSRTPPRTSAEGAVGRREPSPSGVRVGL